MHKFLNLPEFHSGLIWIQTVFANVNKERETGTCTSFRENQSASTDRQIERERERERARERDVFFLNFVIFLNGELVYVFQSFVFIFAKDSDRRDVLE